MVGGLTAGQDDHVRLRSVILVSSQGGLERRERLCTRHIIPGRWWEYSYIRQSNESVNQSINKDHHLRHRASARQPQAEDVDQNRIRHRIIDVGDHPLLDQQAVEMRPYCEQSRAFAGWPVGSPLCR